MITVCGFKELNNAILKNKNKLLFLYFGSKECTPCIELKNKIYENASEELSELFLIYIDTDEPLNEEICSNYNIKFIPMQIFITLNNNQIDIIDTIEGYDWTGLLFKYNRIIEKSL